MFSPRLVFPVRRSHRNCLWLLGVLAMPCGNATGAWAQETGTSAQGTGTSAQETGAWAQGTGTLAQQTDASAQGTGTSVATKERATPAADAPRELTEEAPRIAQVPAPDGNGAPPVPDGAPPLGANPPASASATNGVAISAGAGKAAPPMSRVVSEARMRGLMTGMGLVSSSTQDAILAFVSADEEGKRKVREAGRKLLVGIRRDAPPERLKTLLSEYQSAIEGEQSRRGRAQTALDAQVGYSLDARLESLLWLLGVLGQGQSAFGPGAFGPGPDAFQRAGVLDVQSSELAGEVTAKSGEGETLPWLEIRDEGGHLWRLKPGAAPAARQVLARQINALSLGARVTLRVGTPMPIPVLLAIIPDGADQNPVLTP